MTTDSSTRDACENDAERVLRALAGLTSTLVVHAGTATLRPAGPDGTVTVVSLGALRQLWRWRVLRLANTTPDLTVWAINLRGRQRLAASARQGEAA